MHTAVATVSHGHTVMPTVQHPDDVTYLGASAGFPGPCAFWAPERLVESAWLGHIPFAFWLVSAHRPKVLVELGTHNGASYMAFCQAIHKLGLNTAAYAIDTWLGDPQAGFYDESIFLDLMEYHDRRYTAFSRLIRCEFDDALPHFSDGSIDLLHIDGYHIYDAVRHDFEVWKPKLSERAIVLLHDINVRERDFGAWRLWEELAPSHPSFSFLHHHGLGVLCLGPDQTAAVRDLAAAAANPPAAAAIRDRFCRLGRGIQAELAAAQRAKERDRLASDMVAIAADRDATNADRERLAGQLAAAYADRERLATAHGASEAERERLAAALAAADADRERLTAALAAADADREHLRIELSRSHQERDNLDGALHTRNAELAASREVCDAAHQALEKERRRRRKLMRSISWRATRPLRGVIGKLGRPFRKKRRQRSDEERNGFSPSPPTVGGRPRSPYVTPRTGAAPGLPPLLPAYFHEAMTYATPEPFREAKYGSTEHIQQCKMCCLVHVYYIDLWNELLYYLRNLTDLDHDIYINFVETTVTEEALRRAAADVPSAIVQVSPNRGRDAGGIFRLAARVEFDRYDSVLVIHGKRSLTIAPELGAIWRRTLIEPLVGSPVVARLNASLMAADPTSGLIGSASCCSMFPGNNERHVALLADRLGIPPPHRRAPFVAGSMFFIRPRLMKEILASLQGLDFLDTDRAEAAKAIDGQLEHAIERIYGAVAEARGLRTVWRDTRVTDVDLKLEDAAAA